VAAECSASQWDTTLEPRVGTPIRPLDTVRDGSFVERKGTMPVNATMQLARSSSLRPFHKGNLNYFRF
jgi:hypothetical protein